MEPAGFCWLFVHPHPESFPSVTAKVIYTVVGPRGTREDQGTVPLPAELSLYAQDVARQGTHETSGSSEPRVKIFSQGSFVSFVSFKQPLPQDNVGGKLKATVLDPRISPFVAIIANHADSWGILQENTQSQTSGYWQSEDIWPRSSSCGTPPASWDQTT